MRKLMLVVGLECLFATVALVQNEGKVSNGWLCSKPYQMNSIDVGDQVGHAYAIEQIKCISTKGEYAGVREKEGTGTEFVEVTGNKSSGHGVFVETFANADKATFTYQFTGALADGKMHSGTNKWQATNGTGKFKGRPAAPARQPETLTAPPASPAKARTRFPSSSPARSRRIISSVHRAAVCGI